MLNDNYVTIRQCAIRGPIGEHRLRIWLKEGKLPGVYAGTRFYVNYPAFMAYLERVSADSITAGHSSC